MTVAKGGHGEGDGDVRGYGWPMVMLEGSGQGQIYSLTVENLLFHAALLNP